MTDKAMLAAAPEPAPLPDDVAAMVERLRDKQCQLQACEDEFKKRECSTASVVKEKGLVKDAADMLERLARELAKARELLCAHEAAVQMINAEWHEYLKDGETPIDRLKREIADNHAVLGLLAKAREELDTLRAEADPEALSIAHEYGFQRGKEAMQKELAAVEEDYSICKQSLDNAKVELAAVKAENEDLDKSLSDEIMRRDEYHDMADRLADAIAKHLNIEIGEHSNMNCPWENALEAMESEDPIVTVKAENEKLRGDAERYLFLRHMALSDEESQERYKQAMESVTPDEDIPLTVDMCDAAIDAAMKGEK